MSKQARLDLSCHTLEQLRLRIADWFALWAEKDQNGQHLSQLFMLEEALNESLDAIEQKLDGVTTGWERGALYRECRRLDRNIVLVERFWAYFRDKIEQREDDRFKKILAGADEVVWSCWIEIFRRVAKKNKAITIISPPLAYVDPHPVPLAIPRKEPPRDLLPGDELLKDFLKHLPFPLVRLPPSCVEQPWQLIYVAHEVGHHLQYDLLPNGQLKGLTATWLAEIIEDKVDEDDARKTLIERWEPWRYEIFADLCSVLMVGDSAIGALAELLWDNDEAMFYSWESYPAPVIRLEFMRTVANELKVDLQRILSFSSKGWPFWEKADLSAEMQQDLDLVGSVAKDWLSRDIGEAGPLPKLCRDQKHDFGKKGLVTDVADQLCGKGHPDLSKDERSGRLLSSGAMLGYFGFAEKENSGERQKAIKMLGKNLLEALPEYREGGTRSDDLPDETESRAIGAKKGEEIANLLFGHRDGQE